MFEQQNSSSVKNKRDSDLQAALPALDVRAGMRRAMGKYDIYLNLLNRFKYRFAGFSSDLHRCFAAKDRDAALIQVHSLKGIAASLGAVSLQSAAKKLEQQLQREELPAALSHVIHHLDELLQQLENLDQHMFEMNPQAVCDAENTAPEGAPAWSQSLQELQLPLHKLQLDKVKAQLAQLRQCNMSELQREQFQHLEHLVQGYQYKQAAEYIDGLL